MFDDEKKYFDFDEEYQNYLFGIRTNKLRDFPKISSYVTPDESFDGVLPGYDEKWLAKVGRSHLYNGLILELRNNPNSSYDICYTEQQMGESLPDEFLAIIKRPTYWCEVDFDIFGSRVLNFFEIPTVYNRRFEGVDVEADGYRKNYVCSVSFIKPNEEYFDLLEVCDYNTKYDIKRCVKRGLMPTLDVYGEFLISFWKKQHIPYTKELLDYFKRYMAMSIVVRFNLLNDGDFRYGNAGVLVNRLLKTSRPAPNHDFGELFDTDIRKNYSRFSLLEEWANMYPDDYLWFVAKTSEFVEKKGSRPSVCEEFAFKYIREDNVRKDVLDAVFENASEIEKQANEMRERYENSRF